MLFRSNGNAAFTLLELEHRYHVSVHELCRDGTADEIGKRLVSHHVCQVRTLPEERAQVGQVAGHAAEVELRHLLSFLKKSGNGKLVAVCNPA